MHYASFEFNSHIITRWSSKSVQDTCMQYMVYYRFKILVKTVVQSLANTFVRFAVSMITLINSSFIVMDVASVGKTNMYQGQQY